MTDTSTKATVATPARKATNACRCFTELLHTDDSGSVFGPCGKETSREFAQGHDARLKGLLLGLHRSGEEYVVEEEGSLTTGQTPSEILLRRGWATQETLVAKKRVRKTKKASVPKILVIGRWKYTVDKIEAGYVHYKTAAGKEKTILLSDAKFE